jgi:hypothetical protein
VEVKKLDSTPDFPYWVRLPLLLRWSTGVLEHGGVAMCLTVLGILVVLASPSPALDRPASGPQKEAAPARADLILKKVP